ncbi:MAG: hypothetical protein WBN23_17380, partial [Woeseia sp.]
MRAGTRKTLCAVLLLTAMLLNACGGGGGGGSAPPPPPPPPPGPPTAAELADASRFASQATFGLKYSDIDALARQGKAAWLDRQFALPVTDHTSIVNDLLQRRDAGEFSPYEQDVEYLV